MMIRWLYSKMHPVDDTRPDVITESSTTEATAALCRAENDLAAVKGRAPKVAALTTALRDQRERNHFAELIQHSMWKGSQA